MVVNGLLEILGYCFNGVMKMIDNNELILQIRYRLLPLVDKLKSKKKRIVLSGKWVYN